MFVFKNNNNNQVPSRFIHSFGFNSSHFQSTTTPTYFPMILFQASRPAVLANVLCSGSVCFLRLMSTLHSWLISLQSCNLLWARDSWISPGRVFSLGLEKTFMPNPLLHVSTPPCTSCLYEWKRQIYSTPHPTPHLITNIYWALTMYQAHTTHLTCIAFTYQLHGNTALALQLKKLS